MIFHHFHLYLNRKIRCDDFLDLLGARQRKGFHGYGLLHIEKLTRVSTGFTSVQQDEILITSENRCSLVQILLPIFIIIINPTLVSLKYFA